MPRSLGADVENSFVKGLITEATGLNFPKDAVVSTDNCRFGKNGNVTRRLGFDYEDGYVKQLVTRNNAAISQYLWQAVAGTGTINFTVVQVGRFIYFYDIDPNSSLSPGLKGFSIDLNDFKVSGSPTTNRAVAQFASGKGFLFVSHPYCDPFYIEFLPDTDTITTTKITIKTRDFEGVDDNLRDEERPLTLSKKHKYNLYNQGWYTEVPSGSSPPFGLRDPIELFKDQAQYSAYPNNCDIWWLYKGAFNNFAPRNIAGSAGLGNTPAPKGHFILDEFYQDRSGATEKDCTSSIPGLPIISSGYQRPVTIAFYAGRVWYAGVSASKYSSKIYYSQIVDKIAKVGRCHQAEDPTSEQDNDLLDSDGGVIDIQEIGGVVNLFTIEGAILIFASNGVWSVSGPATAGFSATDFQVNKLSTVPTLSNSSFIDVFGTPVWWNSDGIYTIKIDQGNRPQVISLSDSTIKTFYDTIPANSKLYATGDFNPLSAEVQWFYNSQDTAVSSSQAIPSGGTSSLTPTGDSTTASTIFDTFFNYDSALVLNTLTGGFYTWTLPADEDVNIIGVVSSPGIGNTEETESTLDNSGAVVLQGNGDIVFTEVDLSTRLSHTFKYLTSELLSGANYNITFSNEKDETFVDFATALDGIDYTSQFTTGYKVRGNALAYSQTPYIVTYTKTETDASLYLQVIWDYANSGNSGRIGRRNQVYPARSFSDYQQSRVTLRGKGRAVQLKYSSEAGKPFNCIGWGTFELVNSQP